MDLNKQPRKPAGTREGGQYDTGVTANGGTPTRDGFPNPYTTTEAPAPAPDPYAWENIRARRTPVPHHPTVGYVSVGGNPYAEPDPKAPEYVELAFFDRQSKWIADKPVPEFEKWDCGQAWDTRVYMSVPLPYLQKWLHRWAT